MLFGMRLSALALLILFKQCHLQSSQIGKLRNDFVIDNKTNSFLSQTQIIFQQSQKQIRDPTKVSRITDNVHKYLGF